MDRHPHPRAPGVPVALAALALPVAALMALIALMALAPARAAAPAAGQPVGCLPRVEAAWIRMPPAGLPMMAGYARMSNPCKGPLTIVAAHSAAFGETSLHETRMEGGISRMRAAPALRLLPGGSAVLEPGGFHLMLMQPVKPLHAGERVVVEFTLEDGRRFAVPFEARPIATP